MKILLLGYGKMGHMIEECAENSGMSVALTVDEGQFANLKSLGKIADVAIDFSSPVVLPVIAEYIERTATPLLSGTTGYTARDFKKLAALGEKIPVLYSANYSLGIAVLARALKLVSGSLPGFDIELIEAHHNQKVDAPSGTANRLIEAIDPNGRRPLVYGREGTEAKREPGEIGVHAVRGGTVAGEHSVIFFGADESLEFTHKATSRRIFAEGAINAARILASQKPGYYSLEELIFGKDD